MSKIDVSVIVPVYNVEQYLDKCLKSLVNQNFENYEVIVVNDGSPDNSQKIVDKYVKKYPEIIRSYIKENGGVSSARNYGLEKAKGDYIAFVDSDDYVDVNYLKLLFDEAKQNKRDIVICDIYKVNSSSQIILKGLENKSDNYKCNVILSIPAIWNKLFKKALFKNNEIKFPNCSYGEDLATTGRLIVSSNNVGYVSRPLYYYLDRDGSLMNQKKYNKKMSDIFKSMDILLIYYKSNNYYDLYMDEIEYLFISHLLHDYTLRIYRFDDGKEDIKKMISFIKNNFPCWQKNKYYRKENIKYKIVCNLIYHNYIKVLRLILK